MTLTNHKSNETALYTMDKEKIELLKNTICKDSTNDELQLFLHICKRTGLDPFTKQIYFIRLAGKITVQTGIDGFRLIAERTKKYAPGKETLFSYDEKGKLFSATAFVKKMTDSGEWHEVAVTAYYDEFVQKFKDGNPMGMWATKPRVMLSKCAESQALRKAFPAELSGLYTEDEIPTEAQEEIIKKASKEEIQVLLDLLSECSEEDENIMMERLQKNKVSLDETMPKEFYEKLVSWAKGKKEANRNLEVNYVD